MGTHKKGNFYTATNIILWMFKLPFPSHLFGFVLACLFGSWTQALAVLTFVDF